MKFKTCFFCVKMKFKWNESDIQNFSGGNYCVWLVSMIENCNVHCNKLSFEQPFFSAISTEIEWLFVSNLHINELFLPSLKRLNSIRKLLVSLCLWDSFSQTLCRLYLAKKKRFFPFCSHRFVRIPLKANWKKNKRLFSN